MNRTKRSESTTIRVRPDILELADDLCRERGYSRADLFEMGVLLIDNNNENDLILQKKIYNEMIQNFTSLEESIRKDCDNISEKICNQIKKLQSQMDHNNSLLEEKDLVLEEGKVEKTVDSIVEVINIRSERIKEGVNVEPMGKEYFNYKSKTSGIPVDILINELETRGYGVENLKNVNMFPQQEWRGYVKSKEV